MVNAQKTLPDAIKIGVIAGMDKAELMDRLSRPTVGAVPLFFTRHNDLIVPGGKGREVHSLDSTFRYRESVTVGPGVGLGLASYYWTDFTSAVYYNDGYFVLLKADDRPYISNMDLSGSAVLVTKDLFLVSNYGNVSAYLLPADPSGKPRLMTDEELFTKVMTQGASYDLSYESKYLLFKGIPWYREAFSNLWKSSGFGGYYCVDKDRNVYSMRSSFDSRGNRLQDFLVRADPAFESFTFQTFDYEGNMYLFKTAEVYYIGRDWGYPDAKKGTVTLDGAALKLHPGASELTISTAKSGPVTVFEKTLQKEPVSGKSAAWYKVKLATGLVGWIHGGALTVPEDATLKTFDSPVLGKK